MTGAALVYLLTVAASALPAMNAARSSAGSGNHASHRGHRSVLARVLGRTSSSPVVAAGLRMALEPGRGRTAVPIRSAIFGAALSIVALTASLVFATSLNHVLKTPSLSDFPWDAFVAVDDPGAADPAESALRADLHVAGFGRGGYINVKVGSASVLGLVI